MDRVRIKFWGVRGSLAAPGRDTVRFGGNTTCIEIVCGKTRIICDAGTGLRPLGIDLARRASGRAVNATILLSHLHWDHYIGLPFFQPFFERRNRFLIAGPEAGGSGFKRLLDEAIRPPYMPMRLGDLGARISYKSIRAKAFEIDRVRVTPIAANHPDGAIGWRFDFPGGRSAAVMSDNEPGDDARALSLVEWMAGADVLVHDAQYTPQEYRRRRGWGHSPFLYPIGLARAAEIPRLYLTHFDPESSDKKLMRIASAAKAFIVKKRSSLRCELAREGLCFFL
ncbi:MAG: MBL fold metallo-hydrolase [bacterium]